MRDVDELRVEVGGDGAYAPSMSATTYTAGENVWTWAHHRSGYRFTGPLFLAWEVYGDTITDDYTTEDADAGELLQMWLQRLPNTHTEKVFGPGTAAISWSVDGKPFETAPFQMLRPKGHDEDFFTHYTWPENAEGERVNFNRLPVRDKLWRPGQADKGGFIQEATGWKPSPLAPVMYVGPVLSAAGLSGPTWKPYHGAAWL